MIHHVAIMAKPAEAGFSRNSLIYRVVGCCSGMRDFFAPPF